MHKSNHASTGCHRHNCIPFIVIGKDDRPWRLSRPILYRTQTTLRLLQFHCKKKINQNTKWDNCCFVYLRPDWFDHLASNGPTHANHLAGVRHPSRCQLGVYINHEQNVLKKVRNTRWQRATRIPTSPCRIEQPRTNSNRTCLSGDPTQNQKLRTSTVLRTCDATNVPPACVQSQGLHHTQCLAKSRCNGNTSNTAPRIDSCEWAQRAIPEWPPVLDGYHTRNAERIQQLPTPISGSLSPPNANGPRRKKGTLPAERTTLRKTPSFNAFLISGRSFPVSSTLSARTYLLAEPAGPCHHCHRRKRRLNRANILIYLTCPIALFFAYQRLDIVPGSGESLSLRGSLLKGPLPHRLAEPNRDRRPKQTLIHLAVCFTIARMSLDFRSDTL